MRPVRSDTSHSVNPRPPRRECERGRNIVTALFADGFCTAQQVLIDTSDFLSSASGCEIVAVAPSFPSMNARYVFFTAPLIDTAFCAFEAAA